MGTTFTYFGSALIDFFKN